MYLCFDIEVCLYILKGYDCHEAGWNSSKLTFTFLDTSILTVFRSKWYGSLPKLQIERLLQARLMLLQFMGGSKLNLHRKLDIDGVSLHTSPLLTTFIHSFNHFFTPHFHAFISWRTDTCAHWLLRVYSKQSHWMHCDGSDSCCLN